MYEIITDYLSSFKRIEDIEELWEIRNRLDYLENRYDFSLDEAFYEAFDNHTIMLLDGTIVQLIKSQVLKNKEWHRKCTYGYVYKISNSEKLICAECLKEI